MDPTSSFSDTSYKGSILQRSIVVVGLKRTIWLLPGGEIQEIPLITAAERITKEETIVCYRPGIIQNLSLNSLVALDILELMAFVKPACFCLPTPKGLACALGIKEPNCLEEASIALLEIAQLLLTDLKEERNNRELINSAAGLSAAGWNWSPFVTEALEIDTTDLSKESLYEGIAIWDRLPEWENPASTAQPRQVAVSAKEADKQLNFLLGAKPESRPAQRDYMYSVAKAFSPSEITGEPNVVLAEGGTGVGKTLGYISPAIIWARRNIGTVWLSTYTKNLQHQIDQELNRLYPNENEKIEKVVIRKGRENYLCLLNFEEAIRNSGPGRSSIALGILARWISSSRDGDIVSGDFPAWLSDLFGREYTVNLADKRGECIYSACTHYRRCFIEIAENKTKNAELVIANHALVMSRAGMVMGNNKPPSQYVFDEGHHLFDAADSAFATNLSGHETSEMRRWIRGTESQQPRGTRGLRQRISDLINQNEEATKSLTKASHAATVLPAHAWLERIEKNEPMGPIENFLTEARRHILGRQIKAERAYTLQCDTSSPSKALILASCKAAESLDQLIMSLGLLEQYLLELLNIQCEQPDAHNFARTQAVHGALKRHYDTISMWYAMLKSIGNSPATAFVDWFEITRDNSKIIDIGIKRHWIDPTVPFAEQVLKTSHGTLITSATLRDRVIAHEEDWKVAEIRTGAQHLSFPAHRFSVPSPFNYKKNTRILIVSDIQKNDLDQLANAYQELFLAAGGGALGLFTAIWRLRQVHKRIAMGIEELGIDIYAQHVDNIDTPTLVDIFRSEINSCLMGTDAVRDGVDIPGNSLRLMVLDRVPWPRPDLLHRARRSRFGGSQYDDVIARLRLKQAYGRLIRRSTDRGVFILLDRRTPSRLLGAFPEDVTISRVCLREAIAITHSFIQNVSDT